MPSRSCSAQVFAARPEVLAHNIETVPRIFRQIRPGFRYDRSLDVLTAARAAGLITKSNLILGMGEDRAEVRAAMADLRSVGCDLLTITQYLRPSARHHPVERWVTPDEFTELERDSGRTRVRRRHVGPAGQVVIPGRPALPAGGRSGIDRAVSRP